MTKQEGEDEQSQLPAAPEERQVPDEQEARELMRKRNQNSRCHASQAYDEIERQAPHIINWFACTTKRAQRSEIIPECFSKVDASK